MCLFFLNVSPKPKLTDNFIQIWPMSGYPHILMVSNQISSLNTIFKTLFESSQATMGNPS